MKHLDNLTLSLLADEVLPKADADRALRHISSCPQCEQAYDDFQAISFQLAKLPYVAPPEGFATLQSNIMANLPPQDAVSPENTISLAEHRKTPHPLTYSNWKQWGLYAACFALLASSFFTPNPQDTMDYSSESASSSNSSMDTVQERSLPEADSALSEEAMMTTSATNDMSQWHDSIEANPYITSFYDLSPEQQEFLTQINYGFLLSTVPEGMEWDTAELEDYTQYTLTVENHSLYQEVFPEIFDCFAETQIPEILLFYPNQ